MKTQENKQSKTPFLLVPLVLVFVGVLIACSIFMRNPLDYLDSSIATVELGETVKPSPELFDILDKRVSVDVKQLLKKKKKVIQSKNGVLTTKGKKYLKAGEYPVYLTYKDTRKKVFIVVKDTKKPEFTKSVKTITISDGSQPIELKDKFVAKDKSDKIYISVFTGGVDFSKAGTYNIKIYAEDESGNKAVKKCKLVIENDNESLKQQAGNGKASGQTDGFLNSFKDEETANEIGKEILEKGGCTAYKVVDSGFGSYRLLFRNPTDEYK